MEEALVDVVEQVKRRVGVESRSRSRACDRLAESLKVARAGYRGCQQRNRGGDARRSEDGRRTWETTCMKRDGGEVALLRDDAGRTTEYLSWSRGESQVWGEVRYEFNRQMSDPRDSTIASRVQFEVSINSPHDERLCHTCSTNNRGFCEAPLPPAVWALRSTAPPLHPLFVPRSKCFWHPPAMVQKEEGAGYWPLKFSN